MKLLFALVALLVAAVSFFLFRFHLKTDKTVRKWKRSRKSFLILSTHPSELDAVPLLISIFPRFGRIVAGQQQLYRGPRGLLFRKMGCIGKKQFTPDVPAIREMFETVKKGQILAMMPEGRVSMDGTPSPIDLPTAKLIKKLSVPVAVMKPEGSYFVKPPYNNTALIPGPVKGRLEAVFGAEELESLSVEEIRDKLVAAMDYDESARAIEKKRHYGRLLKEPKKHISNLFYRCPACGALYSMSDAGRTLSCSACGTSWQLDSGARLVPPEGTDALPDNISDWNRTQLAFEDVFWQDENAAILETVKKQVMVFTQDEKYRDRGGGTLSLNRSGFCYTDAEEEIRLPLEAIAGFSADYLRGDIVLYRGDVFYRFAFDDVRKVARLMNSLKALKK